MPIQEGAGVPPPQQQAFTQWNDPQGNRLIALNRDGSIFCEGITFDTAATLTFLPNGPVIGATNIPVISQRLQVIDTTTPQSVSLYVPTTQLIATSLFMQSAAHAGSTGHGVVCTISGFSPLGAETISVVLLLDQSSNQIVMETYPLLVAGGTTLTLSTDYSGGATDDPYTISARLVQMP